MGEQTTLVSGAFQTFLTEAPEHAQAWAVAVQDLASARALDRKTAELAYLAVLAALRLENGVPFHVQSAKKAGASRNEIISVTIAQPGPRCLSRRENWNLCGGTKWAVQDEILIWLAHKAPTTMKMPAQAIVVRW